MISFIHKHTPYREISAHSLICNAISRHRLKVKKCAIVYVYYRHRQINCWHSSEKGYAFLKDLSDAEENYARK